MRVVRVPVSIALAGGLAAALQAWPGLAQQSDVSGTTDSGSESTLREIVITAEKRTSTVQKTPISITAITGKELENLGTTAITAALQNAPGVSYTSGGPGESQFEIRGLSNDGGQSPTVGFYLDETPVSPPVVASAGKVAIDPDLYDLARVEVLRGPQGTLFGAGSMGGTIRLVTNAPDPAAFAVKGQTLLSGTNGGGVNYGQNGMLNLPFLDGTAALRIVGTYAHTSGWIDRVVVPDITVPGDTRGDVFASTVATKVRHVNNEDLSGARASLLVKPAENLSITAGVFHQRIEQDGQNLYDSVPGTLAHYEPFDIAEPFADTFSLYSLTVDYDLPWAKLTSATGYSVRNIAVQQDSTETIASGLGLPAFDSADGGFGPITAQEHDTTHLLSEELRIASVGAGPLQWIAGLFYSRFTAKTLLGITAPGVAALTDDGSDGVAVISEPNKITQKAVFGNVNYNLTGQLKLTAGLRYFDYSSHALLAAGGLLNTGDASQATTQASANHSGFNPMVNIAYFPNDATLLYATAAKGFREGAPNYPLASPDTPEGQQCLTDLQALGLNSVPSQFDPDTVWSYELGEKASLLDQTAILNSDVYYLKWSGVQQPVALPCGETFTTNAADAYVAGGELEFQTRLSSHLRLIQSVGYAYAAFSGSSLAAGITKGQRLLDVPNWTVNTALEYFHEMRSGWLLVGRVSNNYVSSSEDITFARNEVPSRNLMDLHVGVQRGDLSALLFVNNVMDRRTVLAHVNLLAFQIPAYDRLSTSQPRTIGINVNYGF